MIIKKPFVCENCGKERQFKFNNKTLRIYQYKPLCKTCILTSRNKAQNFSPRKHIIKDKFSVIDTQNKAYIFGFIWADGCMRLTKRTNKTDVKSICVRIHPQDVSVLDLFVEYFGGSYKEGTSYDKRNNKTYNYVEWLIHSNEIYDNFIKLNFRKNSSAIPDQLFGHFLRGIIDGDGCFYSRKNCKSLEIFISSTYNQDWSYITDRINFEYSIILKNYNNNKSSSLIFKGNKPNLLHFIYDESTFHLERKYNIIKDFL